MGENIVHDLPNANALDILNSFITYYGMENCTCIKNLKNNKPPGCDMLVNCYMKCTRNIMYVNFFNKFFDADVFRSERQTGFIMSLH